MFIGDYSTNKLSGLLINALALGLRGPVFAASWPTFGKLFTHVGSQ